MQAKAKRVADPVIRTLRRLVIATVVVYIVVGGIAYLTHKEAEKANNALCALREDIAKRVIQGQSFLLTHPQGFAGISAGALKLSIENERRTLDSLAGLPC
jgi:hypothetical protein